MKLKPQFDRARSVVPYVIVNNQELQIHAGLHKTGSTSLQRGLMHLGMLYPSVRSDFRDSANFRRLLQGARHNFQVLSSEHILGEMLDLYSSAKSRLGQIASCDFRSRIIVYLRPHLEWHTSIGSQLIQQGSFRQFDEYFERLPHQNYLSLQSFSEDLIDASTSRMRVEIRVASNVVRDFGQRTGLRIKESGRANPSLSPIALLALRELSQMGYAPHRILRHALIGFAEESRGVCSILTTSQQEHLKECRTDWVGTLGIISNAKSEYASLTPAAYERKVLPHACDLFSNSVLSDAIEHIAVFMRTHSSSPSFDQP